MQNHLDQCNQCQYMYSCVGQLCFHEGLFPLDLYKVTAYVLTSVILGLSSVGGIGGGIEKLPIFMIFLNYDQKEATLFAYVTTFGVNICNFGLLLFQRHPKINKPIIDYDVSLVLLPTVLFGSAFGALLNKVLPDLALICVFMAVMLAFIPKLFIKALEQRNEFLSNQHPQIIIEHDGIKSFPLQRVQGPLVEDLNQEELQRVPWKKMGILLLLFVFVEAFLIIRGGKGHTSALGIEYCSESYWIFTGSLILVLLMLSLGCKYYLTHEQLRQKGLGYFIEGVDQDYGWDNFLLIWIAGLFGGIVGGMIGVGGGAVIVSILLLMGMNSRVASATAGFQKLFMSTFATFISYQQGYIDAHTIMFFAVLGIIGGLFVAAPIYYYLEVTRKEYAVILLVCILLLISFSSGIAYIIREIFFFDQFEKMLLIKSFCE